MEIMFNNQAEVDFLMNHINTQDTVLEWGVGGTTIEIAKRCKFLVSIEHNPKWYNEVKSLAPDNAQLFLKKENSLPKPGGDGIYENYQDYVDFPKQLGIKYDVIFVDGRARVDCARVAVEVLKKGGAIIIHDILHPEEKYRRYEYEKVLDFLEHIDGEFAIHSFKPKK